MSAFHSINPLGHVVSSPDSVRASATQRCPLDTRTTPSFT